MTRLLFTILLATVAVMGASCSGEIPKATESKGQAQSITVTDIMNKQVLGTLGKPLGTIIVIEGVVKDDYYRKMRQDMGETLLLVQSVNGTQLKDEHIFYFQPWQSIEIKKPEVGKNFKFIGYETGGFHGQPQDAIQYVGPVQSTGYGFSTSFVILRDEMKTK